MSEITAITPQIKDKTRCNVYVDGRFYCGITLEAAVKHRLKAGLMVSEDFLDKIQSESEKNAALDKALTHISAYSRTEKEVRQFLRRKGYLASVEDYVIEKMKSYGFINDAAYAKTYALSALKRKGRKLIEFELLSKGVEKEDIEAAFNEIDHSDEDDLCGADAGTGEEESAWESGREGGFAKERERRAAEESAAKFMRGKTAEQKTLAALYRRLISRGFFGENVKEIVDKYRKESED